MRRPSTYKTRHGDIILEYFTARQNELITAAQIETYLQQNQVAISRPTVYRQLEKLAREGKLRKLTFGGASAACFQYITPSDATQNCYHLKCEVCDEVFKLRCSEVDHIANHIMQDHAFEVNGGKTVFYGKCKLCLHKQ